MEMSSDIVFWGIFLVLNSLYFWPRFILEDGRSKLLPIDGFLSGSAKRRLRWFLIRLNYDPLRLSVDFLVLALAYPLFFREYLEVLPYVVVIYVYYGMSLAYQLYYTAFDKIYHLEPVLFHDWFMLKVAVRIFFFEFSWKNFFIALAAIGFALLAFIAMYAMVTAGQDIVLSPGLNIIFAVVAVLGLLCAKMYKPIQFPQVVFQSQFVSFIHNIRASRVARRQVKSLKLTRMKQYNITERTRLRTKPNIYFIVVESYGRIIADNPEFRAPYGALIEQLEEDLGTTGWNVMSNYSESPITGGASWISYTSMLYGLNVKGQGLFLTLFKNTRIAEYDSLFNWLRRQEYKTFRISNLGGYKKMDIPYDRYSELYGVDRWILHSELAYRGPEYGFGPSPPDQYAVHFGKEVIDKETEGPFAVFYISQNSHTPFETPTEVVDDWRKLIDEDYVAPTQSKIWSRPKFDLYGEAISYQLRYLTDFIQKEGNDDDVFILVGDHQPASLSVPIQSFQTPIHVVSKDSDFMELWHEYGFNPGMSVGNESTPIRQEAILWALYRCLIKRYGGDEADIPEFLEKGIPF